MFKEFDISKNGVYENAALANGNECHIIRFWED